jgi:tetratricopeptide (TPR) repeat protein
MKLDRSKAGLAVFVAAIIIVGATFAPSWLLNWWRGPSAPSGQEARLDPRQATDREIERLQRKINVLPNDAPSYALLGHAYLQKARETGDPGYYARAEAALQRSLELQPESFEGLSGMGVLALARHQFRDALDWGERAREINPVSPSAFGIIADARIELGDYDEAVAAIQRMVDLRPDLNSYARVAYGRELHGDIDGAISAMSGAVNAGDPRSEATAWTRVQLGNLYFNKGDIAAAERQYQQAARDWPDYPPGLAGIARVRAAQGDFDRAIALYQQAIAAMPVPEYVIALGNVYRAMGRTEDAAHQDGLVAAMGRLLQAGGVDVDLEMALFDIDNDRDQPQALATLREQYERRPSIHAADALAWALYKSGRFQEADQMMAHALRLGTQDALMFFHLGMIARANGDVDRARTNLERALTLNPHFSLRYAPQAQQVLEELRSGSATAVPAFRNGGG